MSNVSNVLMNWFKGHFLPANPETFQLILFSKIKLENSKVVDNVSLMLRASVKLLRSHTDRALTFTEHISTTCKNAGRQLSYLGRLSNILN